MILNITLLILMVALAVWGVMARSLLKTAMGLALVSIIITIFMFEFNSPLAGLFELSVCTGLITVIFLSTIGLTKPMTHQEILEQSKDRTRRYIVLPVIVIIIGAVLSWLMINLTPDIKLAEKAAETDVRSVLWNMRHLDLLGQIIILLAGVFGAVFLFKEIKIDEWW